MMKPYFVPTTFCCPTFVASHHYRCQELLEMRVILMDHILTRTHAHSGMAFEFCANLFILKWLPIMTHGLRLE